MDYGRIIDFMLASGKRLLARSGRIADIGVTKTDLTEEDLAIERGLSDIISTFPGSHVLYGEEEHDLFTRSESIWVIDPISGTSNFIRGLPHYSIVVSHLLRHRPVFAAVYDPTVDELFTAYAGRGAFLNGGAIEVSKGRSRIIVKPSAWWHDPEAVEKVTEALDCYETEMNSYSMAVNYCSVACGRADGVVTFTKDTFPEFAGALIIREAGGRFTNIEGSSDLDEGDRIFVGANDRFYDELFPLVRNIMAK